MRTLISTFFGALLLTTALATWADDAVKTSQPPYKPGRQLDDGASSAPATAEQQGDGDQSVKSARAPYKPGRQADEQSDTDTSKK
jgi:hypothetical protein